jgi:hypothetical protein
MHFIILGLYNDLRIATCRAEWKYKAVLYTDGYFIH